MYVLLQLTPLGLPTTSSSSSSTHNEYRWWNHPSPCGSSAVSFLRESEPSWIYTFYILTANQQGMRKRKWKNSPTTRKQFLENKFDGLCKLFIHDTIMCVPGRLSDHPPGHVSFEEEPKDQICEKRLTKKKKRSNRSVLTLRKLRFPD